MISYGPGVTETQPFRVGRALLGLLIALVAHAVVLGAAVVVAQTTPADEGFADLAAFLSVLLIGELAILAGALVAGFVLIAKGRKDLGTGLLVGGFLGVIAGLIIRFV
jgi:hypothetical protein